MYVVVEAYYFQTLCVASWDRVMQVSFLVGFTSLAFFLPTQRLEINQLNLRAVKEWDQNFVVDFYQIGVYYY